MAKTYKLSAPKFMIGDIVRFVNGSGTSYEITAAHTRYTVVVSTDEVLGEHLYDVISIDGIGGMAKGTAFKREHEASFVLAPKTVQKLKDDVVAAARTFMKRDSLPADYLAFNAAVLALNAAETSDA